MCTVVYKQQVIGRFAPVQIMIKWRIDFEPIGPATNHDQMDKRFGLEPHFLLFLTQHDFSSVMECFATKFLFTGLCPQDWDPGHVIIISTYPYQEDWDPRGIMLDYTRRIGWYHYSRELDTQSQDNNPLERLFSLV